MHNELDKTWVKTRMYKVKVDKDSRKYQPKRCYEIYKKGSRTFHDEIDKGSLRLKNLIHKRTFYHRRFLTSIKTPTQGLKKWRKTLRLVFLLTP